MTGLGRAKLVVGMVVGVLAVIVALQNQKPVTTNLLFWTVTMPHILLLLTMLAAGFVVGVALSVVSGLRVSRATDAEPRS